MMYLFSRTLSYLTSIFTLQFLYFCTFLWHNSFFDAVLLFFLWWSFWVICTPFFARPYRIVRLLYSAWHVKPAAVSVALWLVALGYNVAMLNNYPYLYPKTFFTSALYMIITRQIHFWPLMFICGAHVIYHALIDSYGSSPRRLIMHRFGYLFVLGYLLLFAQWYYQDFVILFTIRS